MSEFAEIFHNFTGGVVHFHDGRPVVFAGPSPSGAADLHARKTGEVALPGHDGVKAEQLLQRAKQEGSAVLEDLTRKAIKRLLERPEQAGQAERLFNERERQDLADAFAAVVGTANLLGRTRIRLRQRQVEEQPDVTKHSEQPTDWTSFDEGIAGVLKPLAPEKAVAYFRSLVPKLDVDPERFGEDMRRHAFTLAAATDDVLLRKVQDLIAKRLETGEGAGRGAQDVQALLDEAGVSGPDAGYSRAVWRTNVMDALTTGADEERMHPDVIETFPVWKFLGIHDGRQRPSHEVHFNHYFPARVTFAEVRDSVKGEFDGFSCRCIDQPVSRYEWSRLKASGARIADGYPDVPASETAIARHAEELPVTQQAPACPVRQRTGYSCGAAALLSVLRCLGITSHTEADLRQRLGTSPEDGTPPAAIIRVARELGLSAEPRGGLTLASLTHELLAKRPVILCLQAWGDPREYDADENGHWVVCVGRRWRTFFFTDPATGGRTFLSAAELLRRWHDVDGDGKPFVRYGIVMGPG